MFPKESNSCFRDPRAVLASFKKITFEKKYVFDAIFNCFGSLKFAKIRKKIKKYMY